MVLSRTSRNIPETDDADLTMLEPDISSGENAYINFTSATKTFYWKPDSTVVTNDLNRNPVGLKALTEQS